MVQIENTALWAVHPCGVASLGVGLRLRSFASSPDPSIARIPPCHLVARWMAIVPHGWALCGCIVQNPFVSRNPTGDGAFFGTNPANDRRLISKSKKTKLTEDLSGVVFGIHLGDNLLYDSVGADDKGHPVGSHIASTVHAFLDPGSKSFVDGFVLVADEVKG